MKRAKYNEVPKDYRRNYKKESVELLKIVGGGLIAGAIFLLFAIIFI